MPSAIASELLAQAGLDPAAGDRVVFTGPSAVLPSSFAVTDAAGALVAAVGSVMGEVAAVRSEQPRPGVEVDRCHAALSFMSERVLRIGGDAPDLWDPLGGFYEAGDGWVQLHTNFTHHRSAMLRALGIEGDADRASVQSAVRDLTRDAVEDRVCGNGGVAAAVRSLDEWSRHPHAGVATDPLELTSHTGRRRPLGPAPFERPLDGIRVLDLTRIIAGPVCGRILGGYGADVLRVGAGSLPVVEPLLADTTLGKRFCHLDLTIDSGRTRLLQLAAAADVVVIGFRPGALAALGLARHDFRAVNPELVIAELSAFGRDGPWGGRRGFDSITQSATGIVDAETSRRGVSTPTPLPCQILDHGSGHLLAIGVLAALLRRHHDGGGHDVSVSLLGTRNWFVGIGRRDDLHVVPPTDDEIAAYCEPRPSPWGPIRHLRQPRVIEGLPPQWTVGPSSGGADQPVWID